MAKHGARTWVRSRLVSQLIGLGIGSLLFPAIAQAQVTPDNTLGTEVNGSTTNACTGFCQITGGQARGNNLFHSFQQFSLLNNADTAAFITPATIQNMIVRVTGNSNSIINGAIGTVNENFTALATTNFFLLNPNGVVFGPGAQIFVGGSFLASTADRLVFQDGTLFDARDTAVNPLLTISVPVGLQMGATPGTIEMRPGTQLDAGTTGSRRFSSLTLVGGDISLNGANITAPGQRIDLAALEGNGSVEFAQTGNPLQINSPGNSTRADITLNQSGVLVIGDGNGDVSLYGQNITLTNRSLIGTGIIQGSGSITSRSGNLLVDATGTVQLLNGSQVNNTVFGVGSSGEVKLSGQRIEFINGSIAGSLILGVGNAGNVTLIAEELIRFSGQDPNGTPSGILNSVAAFSNFLGTGNGGSVLLQAPTILLNDGAQIGTTTLFASGNAGNIRIEAPTQLSVENSGIQAGTSGIGNAGNIELVVGKLEMTNGRITTSSTGAGNAGTVTAIANESIFNGGGIFSTVESSATGVGGAITLQTGTLTITNGATINASTFGNGDAGNVNVSANAIAIDGGTLDGQFSSGIASSVGTQAIGTGGDVTVQTGTLTITNGATINASTSGNGDAGNVNVSANTIALDGTTPNSQFSSGIFSTINTNATGTGGDVTVQTGTLTLTNGATINASTSGNGDAGNVNVSANAIAIDGSTPDGRFSSGIFSTINLNATGTGGDVTMQTGTLTVTNGATINASTFGNGDAGNVNVSANAIALDGTTPNGQFSSGISSSVGDQAIGAGGDVTIQTGTLTATNGAVVTASTFGKGNAGNVKVFANAIALDGTTPNGQFGSGIFSTVDRPANGVGGNVIVETGTLTVTNGASVNTSTFGNGDAGNVNVIANEILVRGASSTGEFRSGIFSTVESTAIGSGGDIAVTAKILNITDEGAIIASTFGNGNAGTIRVTADTILLDSTDTSNFFNTGIFTESNTFNQAGDIFITADQLRMNNRGLITASSLATDGGNINLNVGRLLLMRNGSLISAEAGEGGNGGNVTINAPRGFIVGVKNENSDIIATALRGSGGKINITAQGVFGLAFRSQLTPFSDINASSTFGLNGVVTLNTPNVDPGRGLVELTDNFLNPNVNFTNSCIVRDPNSGSLTIMGRGGFPERPGTKLPTYTLGDVRGIEREESGVGSPESGARGQQPTPMTQAATIAEAEGIYRLPDGQLILSLECRR